MGQAAQGSGQWGMGVWPATSLHLLLPSAPPAFRSRSLSHVSLRSLYETVHPILFPRVSPSGPLQIAHRSRPMMKWPARKGKGSGRASQTASLSLSLSLTHTVRSLCLPYQAEQSRQIQTSCGIWIISKRGSRFCNGCRRALLWCPITEGGGALFAICPFDLHM